MEFIKLYEYMIQSTMGNKKYFLVVFLSIGIGLHFFSNHLINGYVEETMDKNVKNVSKIKITQFYTNILDYQEIVTSVSKSSLFKKYIDTKSDQDKQNVEDLLLTIAQQNRYLFQLRYLDNAAQEIIRINKTKQNSAYLVKQENLQNKQHRYYFEESIKLPKGKVWFSEIDLNIEYKQVERPLKPTLRVATTVYNEKDEPQGIVIANIAVKQFLYRLLEDATFDLFLVDGKGNYLYHKNPLYAWDKFLEKKYNILQKLPNLTQEDFQKKSFNTDFHFFYKIPLENQESIFFVLTPKQEVIKARYNSYKNTVLSYTILLFMVIALIVYLLYIQKERKQKEQLLKNQRMASLGEMIGNIAHQWRQPLSVISTTATGMKFQNEMGILQKEDIPRKCELINQNAQYLSKTIDDFRNFIKQDRKRKVFQLSDAVNYFLTLSENTIKMNNIEIILDIDESIEIYGYENELVQCFINIFNNAKDAEIANNQERKLFFVTSYIEGKYAVIEMQDNGGGIPTNIQDQIFDPYFTTKHQSQGTGIGLYMTYNIIKNMKGTVTEDNTSYSYEEIQYEGAIFTIKLPIDS